MLDPKITEHMIACNASMRELEAQGFHSGGYDFETRKTAIFKGDYPHSELAGYLREDLSMEWKKKFELEKSYVEQLHEKYGWPLKIHARGYDAYLIDVQPLLEGRVAPIYRFPGGDSLVDALELKGGEGG